MTENYARAAQSGLAETASSVRWQSGLAGTTSSVCWRSLLNAFIGLVRLWRERSEGRRELRQSLTLDHRTMGDIGRGSGEVLAEAEKPFWRA